MKKQDNESLIQELTSRLDWYMMEASDEEFDAEQVQALMKLLDSLKSEEEKIEELPVEEAAEDFWKYCEEREAEERLLRGVEESEASDHAFDGKEKEECKESKFRGLLRFFHRHRLVAVTAAVLVVIVLGGSWQAVANAEKHGGFFWWMDKSEEGTTMITSPEGIDTDSDNYVIGKYYRIEEIPEEYREYVDEIKEIEEIEEYSFNYARIIKNKYNDTLYVYMDNTDGGVIGFEVRIYPQEIQRVREIYPGYAFEKEFENEGIYFEVFSKKELSGENATIMYFYYGTEKYIIAGTIDEENMQNIVIEYKDVVLNHAKIDNE